MRILLIGANGQVGFSLNNHLKKIFKIKSLTREELDVSNIIKLNNFFKKNNFDIIINAVAYTKVDLAEKETEEAFKINEVFPCELAKIAKSLNAVLIHFSSDYVFDGFKKKSYHELDKTNPINIYGKSKLAGEKAIIESDCKNFIFRTSWVVGEHGHNFVKNIFNLSKVKTHLQVINDQFGVPTSVTLICKVIICLIKSLHSKKIWPYGIYHLSPKGATTWFEVANKIFDCLENNKIKLRVTKEKIFPIKSSQFKTLADRPKNSLLNTDKLQKYLKFQLPHWENDLIKVTNKIIKDSKIL
jgi:dTDP-4-dehydrorhamnose reductase